MVLTKQNQATFLSSNMLMSRPLLVVLLVKGVSEAIMACIAEGRKAFNRL
jgi:hypothetical protein